MSRATSQLTVPSRHIFITPIKQSDGTIKSVMSSKPLSDQSVRVTRHIFITPIKQSDGTIKSVMSSKPLSDQSVRVNRAWRGKKWDGGKSTDTATGNWSNSGALFLLTTVWFHPVLLDKKNKKQFLCSGVLQYIVGTFILGVNFATAENVSKYDIAITSPRLFLKIIQKQRSDDIVDVTLIDIVDAAMRGQEDIVLNILNANPRYLLAKAKVKNSVGVEYEVTPLQAAIMANDIQLAERMQEHFAHLTTDLEGNPIDGLAEMHRQIKEIYTQSLTYYHDATLLPEALKNLEAEQLALLQLPTDLDVAQTKRYKTIVEKIKQITKSMITRSMITSGDALKSTDIQTIIDAHNQAQEANAFDFDIYVEAICNASQAELDIVMELINAKTPEEAKDIAKRTGVSPTEIGVIKDGKTYTRKEVQALPFDQLTLVQKLNRFREKSVEHMQREIIFNPNHILTGLKINEASWNDFAANRFTDPGYKKLSVIFSQLAGRLQEKAAEPVKQDIRQGTYYLTTDTNEKEQRSRPSRFNTWDGVNSKVAHNSLVDISLIDASSFWGLGYKFGVRALGVASRTPRPGPAVVPWRGIVARSFFKTYVEQKHRAWKTYCACEITTPVSPRSDVR